MELGNFSVSLNVKDLSASLAFYEKLGFEMCGGNPEQNWAIMQNGDHTIGLFQGMFEHNLLTFNPGWDARGQSLSDFTDIREIKQSLNASGIETPGDQTLEPTGPASFMIIDPDGNPILIDQHV